MVRAHLRDAEAHQVIDVQGQSPGFNLLATPLWFYDHGRARNLWGNEAALVYFSSDEESFCGDQAALLQNQSASDRSTWLELGMALQEKLNESGGDVPMAVTGKGPMPGFLQQPEKRDIVCKASFRDTRVLCRGQVLDVWLIQISHQAPVEVEEDHPRMVEICNNHPMFQFLFDETGTLLTANKRAMYNMKEHLGTRGTYDFKTYLSMGQCDGSMAPNEIYEEAMNAIFKENRDCHRFPQLRWSKRHPGKFRWVLYEMWPLLDPITKRRAVLVCEQNISQVKASEEQFKRQNRRLEAQLEEALAKRAIHRPAIDIDTPADKTLKLLDKIMRGRDVSAKEAMDLRDAILDAGDLRQPVNLNEQLMQNSQTVLDSEVSQSLIQLLSTRRPAKIDEGDEEESSPLHAANGIVDKDMPHLRIAAQPMSHDSVHKFIAISRDMPDKVLGVLSKVDDWQFNAFELNEVSNGRPLSMLSFALFKRFKMAEMWELDEQKLAKFLMKIEDGYPSNPYHNRVHAADVLRLLHVVILRGGLMTQGYCDDAALFCCYLSSIIHDYGHKGVNNDYLVRVSDTLAVLYNDRSPMENHHLAASFMLMNSDEFNFMPRASYKLKETVRKLVIDMVLATDMKQHFAIHSRFQAKIQQNGSRTSSSSSALRPGRDLGGHHKDEELKSFVLQVALKCADLGHLSAPREVHRKWVRYLEEEFFRQGDREKGNGLAVSPLMDREKNGISKSQVGFFDIVALPLFQTFAQAFPDSTPMLQSVKDNYQMWLDEMGNP